MTPFPTSPAARSSLMARIKANLPEAIDLSNTLKAQGIACRMVRYTHGGVDHGNPIDHQHGESWLVDDACVERVRVAAGITAVDLESKRIEKQRIDRAKRSYGRKSK